MQLNRKRRRGMGAVVARCCRAFAALTWQRLLVVAAGVFALLVGVVPVMMLPFIPEAAPGDAIAETVRAIRIDTITSRIIVPARSLGLLVLLAGAALGAIKFRYAVETARQQPGWATRLARKFDRWLD